MSLFLPFLTILWEKLKSTFSSGGSYDGNGCQLFRSAHQSYEAIIFKPSFY